MGVITKGLVSDERTITAEELSQLPHSNLLDLETLLPRLASPDSRRTLKWHPEREALTDGDSIYPLKNGMPLLLPERLLDCFTDRLSVPFSNNHDSFMQYFLLASIKQAGEINAAYDNIHYQRHLYRMRKACHACSGYVLDVGCDDPEIGAGLLPEGSYYIGLDPFCPQSDKFRLVGVGEFLPFQDASFDAVIYNTSLDHILDWRHSLDEAKRILIPGGRLIISTLIWIDQACLIPDAVHFHHFREYEITGALSDFYIEETWRYDYKGDRHRYGLYLSAKKPMES